MERAALTQPPSWGTSEYEFKPAFTYHVPNEGCITWLIPKLSRGIDAARAGYWLEPIRTYVRMYVCTICHCVLHRHHRAAIGVTSNADDSRTVEVGFSDTASLLNSAGDLELPGDTSTGICESYGASEVLAEHNSTTAESRVEVAKKIVDSQSETAAKFLLSLREGRQISQVTVADVICGCKELCQQTSEIIEQGVQEHVVRVGIDFERIT